MSAENDAISLDEARKRKQETKQPPPEDSGDGRPTIRVMGNDIPRIVDEAEQALLLLDDGLYKQGHRVVRVIWDKIKIAGGEVGNALRMSEVNAAHMRERFTKAARFEKWNERAKAYVAYNCPADVAEMYLARGGKWLLPPIMGIVNTPILRANGTIFDVEGYDKETGILYHAMGEEFPEIPSMPTKADALKAIEFLKHPLSMFPFTPGPSQSVALSAILTAVVRRSLPTAPMHAFSAPTAGSGKSLLVDIAAVIATGERASVTAMGNEKFGDVELQKRLYASMIGGEAVISLDNLETPLGGDLLCQLLTQTSVKPRIFGKLENMMVPVTASFFATGNNLTVIGDLTRRVLVGSLDVSDERPELRNFDFHPIAIVKQFRGEFVRAALVVMRAYCISEEKVTKTPLGSFEEWSRMVREPLIWLGEQDPVDVMEDVRKTDPRLQRVRQFMSAWHAIFEGKAVRLREVIQMAVRTDPETGVLLNIDLREALSAVMGNDREISSERVSWWMRQNAGRSVDGVRFVREDAGSQGPKWRVEGLSPGLLGDVPF